MVFDWPFICVVLVKLGLAALLGAVVGYEREMHGRPAGIRTHMLLVIGVVIFSEVSKRFGGDTPDRIASNIVTGVGFLGAGTIMRLGAEIKGLTTAASLFAMAAIGMAVSAGGSLIVVAGAATLLTVFTLAVVERIEDKLAPNTHARALMVKLARREALSVVIEAIERVGSSVLGAHLSGDGGLTVTLDVQGAHSEAMTSALHCSDVVEAVWLD